MTEAVRHKKVLSLLGLAERGHNAVSGEFMTEKAVKGRKASLVIISEEASENTRKAFVNSCEFYKVPFLIFGSKEVLGHAIGKGMRAILAVTDAGLAQAILKEFKAVQEAGDGNMEIG